MRILVTGAAGRLGSYTVAGLHKLGHDVVATDVVHRADMPVRIVLADLLDRLGVYSLVEGCDAVVHLGNHMGPEVVRPSQRLYTENVAMSMNVFQAAVETGVRKILFSSSIQAACSRRVVCFPLEGELPPSQVAHLPIGFETPALPGNHYALSKIAAEDMLALLALCTPDLSCFSIRFPWVLFPWSRHFRHRLNTTQWPVFVDEGFSYLAADDAVSLLDHLLRNGKPGHHIIMPSANDNHLNLRAADLMRLFYKGVPQRKPVDPDGRTVFDITGLEALHGWSPRETTPPFELPADVATMLKSMLEQAWKTP